MSVAGAPSGGTRVADRAHWPQGADCPAAARGGPAAHAKPTMPARPSASPTRLALGLSAACALLLALLAAISLLALQLHFESRDRAQLQAQLQTTRGLLTGVDNAAALAALPARLQAALADQSRLAVRVQGALGQPLYEQGPPAALPASLMAQPSAAHPIALLQWQQDGHSWRGGALLMRLPLDGAAPLTVAMALDIQAQTIFLSSLRWALLAYVLLATLLFGLLARWWLGRALAG